MLQKLTHCKHISSRMRKIFKSFEWHKSRISMSKNFDIEKIQSHFLFEQFWSHYFLIISKVKLNFLRAKVFEMEIYIDTKFCKEAKTIIVADIWLNSLICKELIILGPWIRKLELHCRKCWWGPSCNSF